MMLLLWHTRTETSQRVMCNLRNDINKIKKMLLMSLSNTSHRHHSKQQRAAPSTSTKIEFKQHRPSRVKRVTITSARTYQKAGCEAAVLNGVVVVPSHRNYASLHAHLRCDTETKHINSDTGGGLVVTASFQCGANEGTRERGGAW